MAPECVFQPRLLGMEGGGASEMVFACINGCDIDLRKSLYEHIVW
jgi:actin-related protein 2